MDKLEKDKRKVLLERLKVHMQEYDKPQTRIEEERYWQPNTNNTFLEDYFLEEEPFKTELKYRERTRRINYKGENKNGNETF